MKHRFAKERAADCDAVKAAGQFVFLPCLDGMSVTELMQSRVAVDDVAIDPGILTFRACLDHCRKRLIDRNLKRFSAREPAQCVRHMKIVQRQDGAWIRRKPLDR